MTVPAPIISGASRRRAGTLLLTYGIIGLLLMGGLFLATVSVAFMGRDGFARLDGAVDDVVAVIDSTTAALEQADTTLAGVSVSLGETASALDEAGSLAIILRDGSGTLAEQAGSFSILGQSPFGGIVEPLRDAGASLDTLSGKLATTSAALGANATDVAAMAGRLGAVADSLAAARDRIAGVDTQLGLAGGLGIGVILAIIAWPAVPAVAAIWLGRRWRRENPRA
jgi:hypothetical protein